MSLPWEAAVRDPVRVAAVATSGLVGTGPEDAFDRLIELAAEVVGVSRGCITLVDAERTTAKSALGFPEGSPTSAPVERSFCRFVVSSARPLVVDDARLDPRTRGDPAIETFGAVAWAGYPIEDADGAVLGTFCLMDSSPHRWTARDLHALATLAKAASSEVALLDARAKATSAVEETEGMRSASERERASLEAHLHDLIELGEPSAPVGRDLLAWLRSSNR